MRRAGPEGAEASGGLGSLGGEALARLGGSGPLRGAGPRARPRGRGPGAIPCCASCSAVRARRRAQSCADSCRIVAVIDAGSVWGAARTRAWGGAAAGGFGWAGRGMGAAGGAGLGTQRSPLDSVQLTPTSGILGIVLEGVGGVETSKAGATVDEFDRVSGRGRPQRLAAEGHLVEQRDSLSRVHTLLRAASMGRGPRGGRSPRGKRARSPRGLRGAKWACTRSRPRRLPNQGSGPGSHSAHLWMPWLLWKLAIERQGSRFKQRKRQIRARHYAVMEASHPDPHPQQELTQTRALHIRPCRMFR